MKKDSSEIVIILDRSGSMEEIRDSVISGFNEFIDEQRKIAGEAKVTLVTFSTSHEVVKDHVDISSVEKLDRASYEPVGGTALYDAVSETIDMVGKRLSETPEEERPEHVIVAITTDGEENSSRRHSRQGTFDRITHQTEKYGWNFIFLGANQDAFKAGMDIGISHTLNFAGTSAGAMKMSRSYSAYSKSIRGGASADSALADAQDAYQEKP